MIRPIRSKSNYRDISADYLAAIERNLIESIDPDLDLSLSLFRDLDARAHVNARNVDRVPRYRVARSIGERPLPPSRRDDDDNFG